MSSRSQIDSVIDDDDEFCPLCIEEFDLSDKNFKPCPCGYQICQFCYNNIKTHSEEGRCPNCRRVYDESTIQYKVPDADEFKADLALKHRKAAAAKKKEAEKREIETSSRKNLAGVRVVQKNLVYVIGLNPTIRDENQLLQTLRGPEYFGQYGEIEKIVVSKAKPGGNPNQGIGVYVTFSKKADAATCIAAVDGSVNGDRVLRAQYGTTKYCSSFLRNEQCNNRNCTFLHETGEDSDSYSRQDLSSMNSRQGHPNGAGHPQARPSAQPIQSSSQPMRRQASKDDAASRPPVSDGPALPSSASWASKDAPVNRARRASLTGSRSSPSPKPTNATVANKAEEAKRTEKQSAPPQDSSRRGTPAPANAQSTAAQSPPKKPQSPPQPENPLLDSLVKAVNSPDFKFVFSTDGLPAEEVAFIENHPSFIDPYGGVKRRAMREKAEQERAKQEAESRRLLQSAAAEEENRESGSLQLGGEPDDVHPRGGGRRETHGAIQPPSQQGTATNSVIGSPASATSHQFQGLNIGGRSLTPLQQQQLMLLKSANGQQAGLMDPLQTGFSSAGFDHATQARQGLLQSQMPQLSGMQGHNRQSSRFSFADSGAKNASNARTLNQQASLMQSGTPNPLAAPTPQYGLANHLYTSGVQGPPPGLKTAGTPPISGGGMFAQGHGFTTNTNLGLGANLGKQDANPELMRELLRGRSGTGGAGGVQGHDAAKREFMFPFLQQHQTPPPLAPATGLLSSFYGSQTGTYPEPGPQKQKKKGKKHRHANTSSGGGGVVDLADPSILQARMQQVGANAAAGQALYGSQGQVDEEFPPLGVQPKDRRSAESFGYPFRHLHAASHGSSIRSGTPTLPPGLPLPHAHPAAAFLPDSINPSSPSSSISVPTQGVTPVVPRLGTPAQKLQENISRRATPEVKGTPEPGPASERVKNASEISLGSPKPKPASKNRAQAKAESPVTDNKDSSATAAATADAAEQKDRAPSGKPKPIKLSLSAVQSQEVAPPQKAETASQSAPGGPASSVGSRPNTPLTGISRASDSSGQRQPRVLRVVDTPKAETPPPASSTQSVSSAPAAKGRSRRPSVSSLSRPATPGDVGSDYDPYTSASVSRANSPPPSRVGSAPVRTMTKSQAKKERRLKAKQAEAKKEEEAAAAAPPEEPVQAPIIGRKRKTKKTPSSSVEQSANAETNKTSDKADNDNAEKAEAGKKGKAKDKNAKEAKPNNDEKASIDNADKTPAEAWRSNNTVEQMIADSQATGTPIKDLFLERTSSLQVLLAQLHKSGALDLNSHPLFNLPNLNQRSDMKCSSDDYDVLRRPIELTEEHRKQLRRGEPVRINADSTHLKSRCLITPSGCVLRHLSPEEEERYLALEKSLASATDSLQEYPAMSITEPDITNRGGGLEALFATPEKFNIRWVDDASQSGLISGTSNTAVSTAEQSTYQTASAPPNVLSAMEADCTRSHNWAIANTAELVNATAASVRSFAAATAKHMLGASVAMGDIQDIEDLLSMSDEELRTFIDKSQKELETSRKEADAIDKKLMALVKRNKKLAQQALATTVEVGGTAS